MGCFSVQKSQRRGEDVQIKARTSSRFSSTSSSVEREAQEESRSVGERSSFRRKLKNTQIFDNGTPKLSSSSHPGYGRSHRNGIRGASTSSSSFFNLLGRRTRSVTEVEVQSHAFAMEKTPSPMPLPFPRRSARNPNSSAYRLPRPQELAHSSPLPSSNGSHDIPWSSSFKMSGSCPTKAPCQTVVPYSDPQPLPRPPRETLSVLRAFTYDELGTACNDFSADSCVGNADTQLATYEGVLYVGDAKPERKLKITIVRLVRTSWKQSPKEWHANLEILAKLHDDHHLCKILGYHAKDGGTERFVVYQGLAKGSLDRLLYGKRISPTLEWSSRMKIAKGAAQDLAFLHERVPEPIIYGDFRSCHIHVDTDFSAKLSGYGFSSSSIEFGFASAAKVEALNAPELQWSCEQGSSMRSTDVWNFGVLLLELLTGRRNMDLQVSKEERNLVRWTRPYLRDEGRLFLMMDPKLGGQFQSRSAKIVGALAHRCLQKDSSQRPTMLQVVKVVETVQSMCYNSFRFPSRDLSSSPIIVGGGSVADDEGRRSMSKFDSVSAASLEMKAVTKFDVIENPPLKPLTVPPRSSCSRSFAMEEEERTTGPQQSRAFGRLESF